MNMESLNPLKRDADAESRMEIVTYEVLDSHTGLVTNHVIKQNGKPIAWARSRKLALHLHGLFVKSQIFHEAEVYPLLETKLEEIRLRLNDNPKGWFDPIRDYSNTCIRWTENSLQMSELGLYEV